MNLRDVTKEQGVNYSVHLFGLSKAQKYINRDEL